MMKAQKDGKDKTDTHVQSSTDTDDNIPQWKVFVDKWKEHFMIAKPEIPLYNGAWSRPTRHCESYCLLATHVLSKGNIGVMPGVAKGLAKTLLEQLHLAVKWDGSLLNGRRRIEFLRHEEESIIPSLDDLEEAMGTACRTLLPDLLPQEEYVFKVVGEASLCPAPRLNDIEEKYEWSYSEPKVPSEEYLRQLAVHKIFSFWGFFPLTKDGMFIHTFPPGFESRLVFIPAEKGLLCPIQIPCMHDLRTTITESPACKFCIYLVPKMLDQATVNELFVFHDNPSPEPVYDDAMLKELGRLVGF
jgi:hypothetical protein